MLTQDDILISSYLPTYPARTEKRGDGEQSQLFLHQIRPQYLQKNGGCTC